MPGWRPQVVHQQVADWPTGQIVAVDELLDAVLPGELTLNIRTPGWDLTTIKFSLKIWQE